MLGGERGSLTPELLEENDHLALGHRHSGSNSASDLATPMETYGSCLYVWIYPYILSMHRMYSRSETEQ